MSKPIACGLIFLAAATVAFPQGPDPRKPPTLRLGDAATPERYEATLAIDPGAPRFSGEIRIVLRFNRATPVLWLNATKLEIASTEFRQGSRTIAVTTRPGGEDFIGFEATGEPFAPGEATATITYTGAVDAVATQGIFRQREGGDWYGVTQFQSEDARRAFPCFDEPGWKTPWTLAIDAPAANVVVANTPEVKVDDAPGRAGWKRHAFAPTKPLPSYLVAFAVGPFEVVDGGKAGRNKTPLRYLAPRGRGAETRWAKESTPRLLEYLEAYFGIPYPYEKLDSVTIPQPVNFGAMENAGLVTYAQTLLLARPDEETPAFKRRYVGNAAHEIAHMWFGNLVTLAWWDDTWLSEAFATWMGQKATAALEPAWDGAWQRAISRRRALHEDRLPSSRRIHDAVATKDAIEESFDRITYDKGGQVLAMFEAWLTPERFREGVRGYLKAHAHGTATSSDFFRALGDAAGKRDEALAAFTSFVDQPGIPLMDVARACEPGKPPALEIHQHRFVPAGARAPDVQWTTPACFRYGYRPAMVMCTEVKSGRHRYELPAGSECPAWVFGNAGGGGHYVVRTDERLASGRMLALRDIPDGEAVVAVNDAALLSQAGLLPLADALKLFKRAFAHESAGVRQAVVEALRTLHREHLDRSTSDARSELDEGTILPLARRLGWREKPGESDELRDLRFVLLPYAASMPKGAALRQEAGTLVRKWLKDRDGIDPMMLAPVLDTAARHADAALFEALEIELVGSQASRDRRQLLSALAKVRDPALRARALAMSVEKAQGVDRMPGRDTLAFLEEALEDDANRRAAFAFVRENFDAIAAKLPPETPGQLVTPLERLCTPEDREQLVAFFRGRAGKFLRGQRKYEQAVEAVGICIAAVPR